MMTHVSEMAAQLAGVDELEIARRMIETFSEEAVSLHIEIDRLITDKQKLMKALKVISEECNGNQLNYAETREYAWEVMEEVKTAKRDEQ